MEQQAIKPSIQAARIVAAAQATNSVRRISEPGPSVAQTDIRQAIAIRIPIVRYEPCRIRFVLAKPTTQYDSRLTAIAITQNNPNNVQASLQSRLRIKFSKRSSNVYFSLLGAAQRLGLHDLDWILTDSM